MQYIVPCELVSILEAKQAEKDQYDLLLASKEVDYLVEKVREEVQKEEVRQRLIENFTDPVLSVRALNQSIFHNEEALKIAEQMITNRLGVPFSFELVNTPADYDPDDPIGFIGIYQWKFEILLGKIKKYAPPERGKPASFTAPKPDKQVEKIKKKYDTLTQEQAQVIKDKQNIEKQLKEIEKSKSELELQNNALSQSLNALTESSSMSLIEIQTKYQERIKSLESLLSKKDDMLKQKTLEIKEREKLCETVQTQNEKIVKEFGETLSETLAKKDEEIKQREQVLLLIKQNEEKIKAFEAKEAVQASALAKIAIEKKYENLSKGKSSSGYGSLKKTSKLST